MSLKQDYYKIMNVRRLILNIITTATLYLLRS